MGGFFDYELAESFPILSHAGNLSLEFRKQASKEGREGKTLTSVRMYVQYEKCRCTYDTRKNIKRGSEGRPNADVWDARIVIDSGTHQ